MDSDDKVLAGESSSKSTQSVGQSTDLEELPGAEDDSSHEDTKGFDRMQPSIGVSDLDEEGMLLLKKRVFEAAEAGNMAAISDSLRNVEEHVRTEILHHHTERDGESVTPLMIAARWGHYDVVCLLVKDYGVAVDQVGTLVPEHVEGVSPLWCVTEEFLAWRGIMQVLLDGGADVNRVSAQSNETPLFRACRKEHVGAIEYLLCHGASANLPNQYGHTPLMAVCSGEKAERIKCQCIKYLLDRGADPNRQDSRNCTALHLAAIGGKPAVVTLLLNRGATLMEDSEGLTPSLVGMYEGRNKENTVRSFVEHAAVSRQDKVDALETMGALLLLQDVECGLPYLREAMVERWRDPNNILCKPSGSPVPALGNVVESQNLEELEDKEENPYALFMECLLILERTFGDKQLDMSTLYWNICSVLLHIDECRDKILPMCHHLMQKHPQRLLDCLQTALNFAGLMTEQKTPPKACEIEPLIDFATETWENTHVSTGDIEDEWEMHPTPVDAALTFCELSVCITSGAGEEIQPTNLLKRLVKVMDSKTAKLPDSLMHKAVTKFTHALCSDNEAECSLQVKVISLLAKCEADVNVSNRYGSTPLAKIIRFRLREKPYHSEVVQSVVEILTKAGAHLDCVNSWGKMADDGADVQMQAILREYYPLPLKCLATRAIINHNLPYQSSLPEVVQKFVKLHKRKRFRVKHKRSKT